MIRKNTNQIRVDMQTIVEVNEPPTDMFMDLNSPCTLRNILKEQHRHFSTKIDL